MDIDLTTVIAQIVNFSLLVWLLQRFLYKPITNAITAREQAVKGRLEEADQLQAQAKEQIALYEQKQAELERTREQYLKQAREEADVARKKMLEDVAEEGETLRRRYAGMLANEQAQFRQAFQERMIKQVCGMSATLIHEVAGRSLEDGLIDGFEKALVREEVTSPKKVILPVKVRLSFSPNDDQKSRIHALVEQILGRSLPAKDVQYTHEPSLILGIEIDYNQAVFTWSAEDHLQVLEEEALDVVRKLTDSVDSEVLADA